MRGSTPYVIIAVGILIIATLLFVQFGGLTVVFSMGFGKGFHSVTTEGTAKSPAVNVTQAPTSPTPAPAPTPAGESSRDAALVTVLERMAETSRLQSEAFANQTKALQQQTEVFNQLRQDLKARAQPEQHRHSHGCSHSEWSPPIQRYQERQ